MRNLWTVTFLMPLQTVVNVSGVFFFETNTPVIETMKKRRAQLILKAAITNIFEIKGEDGTKSTVKPSLLVYICYKYYNILYDLQYHAMFALNQLPLNNCLFRLLGNYFIV